MVRRSLLRALPATLLGLAAGAPLVWVSSCSDASNPQPDGGGGAGGSATVYTPTGCDFQVVPRPEYTDWAIGRTDTGATPGIVRVRLGLGGKVSVGATGRADPATSVGFSWETTDDATLVSEVAWGTTPDPSGWAATDRASGISWLTPEGFINGAGDQRMHEVHVCGLQPDTTYYYRVGGGPAGQEAWSDVLSWKTTPAAGAAGEVVIGVAGDARGQENDAWRLIQRRMLAEQPDLQLFSGDVTNFATDQQEWERWLGLAETDTDGSALTLGGQLVLTAHGNHENHSTFFFSNLVLPQEETTFPTYGELFFSVDVGPVHVVVLDDGFIASANLDPAFLPAFEPWLRADLTAANANRASVPWVVVMHHHSAYSSSTHGMDSDVLDVRAFVAPIWDEFDVDLEVAGHDHNYERSKLLSGDPGAPTIADPGAGTGTMYLVSGGAGADAYAKGTSAFTATSLDNTAGAGLGFYSFLRVTPASLVIESHELRADATDPIVDTVTLTK